MGSNRRITKSIIDATVSSVKSILKRVAFGLGFEILRRETFKRVKSNWAEIEEIHSTFLKQSTGVLHVGAHQAQERFLYGGYGLRVLWVEGDNQHIEHTMDLLTSFPNQNLVQLMLSDESTLNTPFYIANNNGASSSLLDLDLDHGFDNLMMVDTKFVETKRADHFFSKEEIWAHNHLVLDVQGAELKVLKGFGSLLAEFKTLYIEVSTYPIYKKGATFEEISQYLETFGIHPLWQPKERSHENILFLNFNP